jgi:phosphohistidine phosphatase
MKRLILIRHAKSSWDAPFVGDHKRSLNERGYSAARTVGKWLAEQGHVPDHVQCSTATRCRETWDGIKEVAGFDTEPDFVDAIYHASSDQMLTILNRASGDTLMMLGHNPGISDFAERLIDGVMPDHPKFPMYPTAAVTILDFDIEDWGLANFGFGHFVDFVVPKELG